MTDDRRLMLTIALCLAIYLGWSWMLMATKRKESLSQPATTTAQAITPAAPAPERLAPSARAAATPTRPEQRVELESPELRLVFSTRGATLLHATLKNPQYRRRLEGKDVPVDLVRGEGGEGRALRVSFDGASWPDDPLADYDFKVEPGGRALVFRRQEGKVVLTRRFALVSPYLLEMSVAVEGGAARQITTEFGGTQPPGGGPAPSGIFGKLLRSYPNVATALCRVDGKSESSPSNKASSVTRSGTVQFGGLDERFFVAALAPQGPRTGSCVLESSAAGLVAAKISLPIAAGAAISETLGLFLGPKDLDLLQRSSTLPGEKDNAELESSVGFGFWTALCVPMLRAMEFFRGWIPNWGVAILLLTVVIKLVMYPLQQAQYRSMEKMKLLQPKVEELKKRLGDDKERLNVEMMKLYTENKVNPLGGCLPMILQMPIWWALYRLLGTTIQLYREPFIRGWIDDLTAPDHFYILPLAMGVTMVVTQLLSPQMADSGQQRLMMWMMPILFTVFFLNLPAGLTLYIFASNLLNIAQQYLVRAKTRRAAPPGRVAAAGV